MIKLIESEDQAAFVEMVATQLTGKFMMELRQLCNRKNYFTHAGILAEMFDWSMEFFDLYYLEFGNFSEATDVEESVIAFGNARYQELAAIPSYLDSYFIAKYKNDLKNILCPK